MQPDETRRIGRVIGHAGDRYRTGVRGHDSIGRKEFPGLFEDRLLDRFLLGRGLDDEIGILHARIIGDRRDAFHRRFGIGDFDLALADQLAERLVDPGMRLFGNVEADIRQQDIHAVRSHGLRDAGAHLARTDDSDRLVHRNFPSHVQQNACTSEGSRRWLAPA